MKAAIIFTIVLAGLAILSTGCASNKIRPSDEGLGYSTQLQRELYSAQNRKADAEHQIRNLEDGIRRWREYEREQRASLNSNEQNLTAERRDRDQDQNPLRRPFYDNNIARFQRNIEVSRENLRRVAANIEDNERAIARYRNQLDMAERDIERIERSRTPGRQPITGDDRERAWREAERIRPFRATGWRCNFAGVVHSEPRQCQNPQIGGTWLR